MNEIIPDVEAWLRENNPPGVTRCPDGAWELAPGEPGGGS